MADTADACGHRRLGFDKPRSEIETSTGCRALAVGVALAGSERRVAGALDVLAKQGLIHLRGETLEVSKKGVAILGAHV
ncbi:MAG: hypothetical protein PVJ32_07695 [Anaerolineales bacterium]